jgi:hypothetical protein
MELEQRYTQAAQAYQKVKEGFNDTSFSCLPLPQFV